MAKFIDGYPKFGNAYMMICCKEFCAVTRGMAPYTNLSLKQRLFYLSATIMLHLDSIIDCVDHLMIYYDRKIKEPRKRRLL